MLKRPVYLLPINKSINSIQYARKIPWLVKYRQANTMLKRPTI